MYNPGSSLTIYNTDTPQQVVYQEQIFANQNIHGIISKASGIVDGARCSLIVIWGGRLLSFAILCTQGSPISSDLDCVTVKLYKQTSIHCEDWIFSVAFTPEDTSVYLLTAHNALYRVRQNDSRNVSRRLESVATGLQTLLYSGHIVVKDSSHMVIASGTVFGEIVVWTCSKPADTDDWFVRTKHVFLGHQGSVFGVSISTPITIGNEMRRFLASCSDDRTIRIWDISGCDLQDESLVTTNLAPKQTGFGNGLDGTSSISMAWGHASRIWDVTFIQNCLDVSDSVISLVSRGEDGVFQHWSIDLQSINNKCTTKAAELVLNPRFSDRYHNGKNLWSSVNRKINGLDQILTGGADGQIVMRQYNVSERFRTLLPISITFAEIVQFTIRRDTEEGKPSRIFPKALKQYLLLGSRQMLATTDHGDVLLSSEDGARSWTVVHAPTRKVATILSCNHEHGVAFFSNSDSNLSMFSFAERRATELKVILCTPIQWMQVLHVSTNHANHSRTINLLVNLSGGETRFFMIKQVDSTIATEMCVVETPTDFIVTSGYYNDYLDLLLCGSRAGALALFRNLKSSPNKAEYALCIRHIHGSDSVTSIIELSEDMQSQYSESLYILTTGRDGTFACHLLTKISGGSNMKLRTVHRSNPPFGPYIEGVYRIKKPDGACSLNLYGFHSKNFVVWNESYQMQLMSVECGGAHRSWNYYEPQNHEDYGTFVWTKAGTFNMVPSSNIDHQIIQYGGHGREIKAFSVFHESIVSNLSSPAVLLATGAEDTDIRLFEYKSDIIEKASVASLRCIAILKGHTTGLQHLMFSDSGRFLFSSAGCEEFYVWQLNRIPLLGIGAVLAARLRKDSEDSDARIMNFDFVNLTHCDQQESCFNFALAYSNGKTKHLKFTYDHSNDVGNFEILHQTDSGAICLTQIHSWQEDNLDPFVFGATDGSLRVIYNHNPAEAPRRIHVHQSNIAAMSVHTLNPTRKVVVTGGDDNALGITILQSGSTTSKQLMRTIVIPGAHAAAVTAVTTLEKFDREFGDSILIISAGNDQKVKLWCASIDQEDNTSQEGNGMSVQLNFICERSTDVADISSMDMIYRRKEDGMVNEYGMSFEVMVVGVGMQVIGITYQN